MLLTTIANSSIQQRQSNALSRTGARPFLLISVLVCACGDSPTGPRAASCGTGPLFTILPVDEANIQAVSVIGGLGAPGHTLPTDHAGIFLTTPGTPVRSPGELQVTTLRRVKYVTSPTRQGATDFALEFAVCRDVTGWFGHLVTLSATIPSVNINWTNCQTYSTSDETVESCSAKPSNLTLSTGSAVGTAGLSVQSGQMALDVGLLDERVTHFYITPQRFPPATFHAVCAWERFDAASQAVLFSKLRDRGPGFNPSGEPRCGTMQVDVAGTAKGVWAEVGVTGQVAGDERRYITLANYPYRPQEYLALSLGPASLGAMVAVVPRQNSGRVNRTFEQVTADGTLYCYTDVTLASSWFLALSAAGTLTISRRTHAGGASPCNSDPTTWTMGTGAVALVR